MNTSINQRIKLVIDNSGLTLSSYSKLIGLAQSSLRDCVINNSEPKFSTLDKILKADPLINPGWLLTGNGEMKLSGAGIISDSPPPAYSMVNGSSKLINEDDSLINVIASQQRTIEKLTDFIISSK